MFVKPLEHQTYSGQEDLSSGNLSMVYSQLSLRYARAFSRRVRIDFRVARARLISATRARFIDDSSRGGHWLDCPLKPWTDDAFPVGRGASVNTVSDAPVKYMKCDGIGFAGVNHFGIERD